MSEKLNIVKDYLQSMDFSVVPLMSVLSAIQYGSTVIDAENISLFSGFLNSNGTMGQPVLCFDPRIGDYENSSISLFISAYSDPLSGITIAERLELAVGETIASRFGSNFREACLVRRAITLAQGAGFSTPVSSGTTDATINLNINGSVTPIALLHYDVSSKEGKITKIENAVADTAIIKAEALLAAVIEYKELLTLAVKSGCSYLLGSAIDFGSAIQSYLGSMYASVRRLARELQTNWFSGPFTFINGLFAKFQNKPEVQVNSDGSVTWGGSDIHAPITNPFVFAVSAVGAVATTIGSVLLFTAPIIGKVIGAVLMVGGSVASAIMSTISSAAGTVPTVLTEAPEPTYCDYIAYRRVKKMRKFRIPWQPDFKGKSGLENVLNEGAYSTLVNSGQLVISTAYWTIFIYNYVINGLYEEYEYKIFPNTLTGGTGGFCLTLNKLPSRSQFTGYNTVNYVYKDGCSYTDGKINGSPIVEKIRDSSFDRVILPNELCYAFNRYSENNILEPSAIVCPSMAYEDWDDAAGGVWNSIYAIECIGGMFGCFDGTTNTQYPMDNTSWTGELFSHLPSCLNYFRSIINSEALLFSLILVTGGVTRLSSNTSFSYDTWYYTNGGTKHSYSVHGARIDEFIDGSYYSPELSGYAAMLTAPSRSIYAMIAGAAIAAVTIAVTIIAIKVISTRLSNFRQLKRRAKIQDFQERLSHFDLSEEDLKQFSKEDQKDYRQNWRKLLRDIKLFNFMGTLFGNTTYDYRNDWVEVPADAGSLQGGVGNLSDIVTAVVTPEDVITSSEITGVPTENLADIDYNNVTIADIYRILCGIHQS